MQSPKGGGTMAHRRYAGPLCTKDAKKAHDISMFLVRHGMSNILARSNNDGAKTGEILLLDTSNRQVPSIVRRLKREGLI